MSKNYRANRRREPDIRQIDKQGWKSLVQVIMTIVLTCIVAIGIPYGIYMYYRHLASTDYFLPRHISIQGNVRVDDAAILDASGLQADGANLFAMDVHTIQGSIKMLPWVKSAKVEIELPDKVSIEIQEHVPLGIVNDGQMHVVDTEGAYIKHWQTEDAVMVPIVSLDKPLSVRTHVVVQAFDLAERITRRGYPHKIDEIHYDDATGYTVFTAQSEIRMGYDRFDERIDRLMTVDQHLSKRHVEAEYILLDGEVLDRVIVKPRFKPTDHKKQVKTAQEVIDVPVLPSAVPTPEAESQKLAGDVENSNSNTPSEFPAVVGEHIEENEAGLLKPDHIAQTATAEVKPATTEIKPATAEIKPATAEIKPATAEIKPATAEIKPATAEIKPATAEIKPATAKIKPATAEIKPAEISDSEDLESLPPSTL